MRQELVRRVSAGALCFVLAGCAASTVSRRQPLAGLASLAPRWARGR